MRVWQLAMDLVVDVYEVSRHFPTDERYGLTAQIRRAAVSIPANLAEGKARMGNAEFRRFVLIARGSLAELETELEVAQRLDLVSADQSRQCTDHAASVGRMLTRLAKALTP